MNWADVTVVYVSLASASLIGQSVRHLPASVKVIVVDNGCLRCGTEFASEIRGIDVLAVNRNIGFGAAANLGVASATTEFVLLLNPDCVIDEQSLAMLVYHAKAAPSIGALTPRIRHPITGVDGVYGGARYGVGSCLRFALLPDRLLGHHSLWARAPKRAEPLTIGWAVGTCMLVRRAAFLDSAGFDERFFMYCEDRFLGAQLARAGWSSVVVPDAVALHEGGESTNVNASRRYSMWRQSFRLAMTLSPGGRLQARCIAFGLAWRSLLGGPMATQHRQMSMALFVAGGRHRPRSHHREQRRDCQGNECSPCKVPTTIIRMRRRSA